jgi:hypothetical protein
MPDKRKIFSLIMAEYDDLNICDDPQRPINPSTENLIIEGEQRRDRLSIYLFGSRLFLTFKSFRYLSLLAIARKKNRPDGWIHCEDFETSGNAARYIYNLRHDISPATRGYKLIQNDRDGKYRLTIRPDQIFFLASSLANLDDLDLRAQIQSVCNLKNLPD